MVGTWRNQCTSSVPKRNNGMIYIMLLVFYIKFLWHLPGRDYLPHFISHYSLLLSEKQRNKISSGEHRLLGCRKIVDHPATVSTVTDESCEVLWCKGTSCSSPRGLNQDQTHLSFSAQCSFHHIMLLKRGQHFPFNSHSRTCQYIHLNETGSLTSV